MRTYYIYLDRIETDFDELTLEPKLISLSQELFNVYLSMPLGKGSTYRHMSYLIEDLVRAIDFNNSVDEVSVVGVLRHSLSFLRRHKFPDFQINILNHV